MRLDFRTATRLAVRGVRRDAPTSVVTALTLALGIGASTTLLGLVTGATRDLPVPDGHQIVRVDLVRPEADRGDTIGAADLRRWRETAASIVQVGTARALPAVLSSATGNASRESAAALSPEMLPLLRVTPAMGRFPDPGDPAIVVSWDLWQHRFAAAPDVLGTEVRIDGEPHTVIGVMPEGFRFPLGQDIWFAEVDGELSADVEIIARLRDGSSIEQATAELQALWQGADEGRSVGAAAHVRVRSFTGGRGETGEAVAFAALGSIVLALLVVACINGSTLLLLRASRRGHVAGVQRALGASRAQVGVQLLLEAALIALAGGVAGLGLTWLAVQWVDRVLSVHFGYYWMRMAIDGPVLGATAVLITMAAVLAGALPAWRAMQADPADVLRSGARGRGVGRAGSVFLTLQVAGATAALVGGVLLASGLGRWGNWQALLPPQPVVQARVDLSETAHAGAAAADTWRQRWLLEMAPLPAALAIGVPGFAERVGEAEIDTATEPGAAEGGRIFWNAVSAGFFDLFEMPVVAGRGLTAEDGSAAPAVAVVNTAFVRRHLQGTPPLQARLRIDGGAWLDVVGVVEGGEADDPVQGARVYVPLAQTPAQNFTLLVGAGSDVGGATARLRDATRRIDPDVPLDDIRTLEDFLTYLTRVPRTIATVGIGGAFAGLLTMLVGLYGLLSFDVRQRTFEIGVRMAVGADGRAVAAGVIRRALLLLLPGVLGGLGVMYALAPLFGLFLFGTEPRAPLPFALVGAAMLLVGVLAALMPARTAVRVQPAAVLRSQ